MERKEETSLPPNYVSLAQLQEQWLKKQQELKLKKAQEEEIQSRPRNERGPKNDGYEKMAGGSVRDVPRSRVKDDGHEKMAGGSVRDDPRSRVKDDGREKMAGGSVRDVPRRRVKNDGREMGAVEYKEKGKEIALGGFQENQKKKRDKNRYKGQFWKMKSAEDEEKGEQEEKGEEVEKKIEIKEFDGENQDVKKMDLRGGLERNGNNIRPANTHYKSKEVYRVRVNELKQSEEVRLGFGGGNKWRGRRRNGVYPNRLKEEEDKPGALKDNGESEKDEISLSSLSGIDGNGGNKTDERRVEGQLNDNEVLVVVERAKNGNKGKVRKNRKRRLKKKEDKPGALQGNGESEKDEISLSSLSGIDGTGENKMDECRVEGQLNDNEVVVVVESVKNGDKREVGKNRNRLKDKQDKQDKPGALKGDAESEKDEISLSSLSGIDGNGGNKTDERRVEGQLNDNEVSVVVESAKKGDKGEVGKNRRYENWKGTKPFNVRSRVEVNVGKFEGRWKTTRGESGSGTMWVKKEKSGAAAEVVGSSLHYYDPWHPLYQYQSLD